MPEGPESVAVVVDLNEPEPLRLLTLDHPDVGKWREEVLDAADIVINGVGFERKTPSDFASSMMDGRLDAQAEKLTDAYDHAYVLIEGDFSHWDKLTYTSLNPHSLRGKAASLTARYGLPVIPTSGNPDTPEGHRRLIDYAIRLARKHTEAPTSSFLPTGPVGRDEPAGKRMWACLPNVGPELADRLWEAFGSPVDFVRYVGPADAREARLVEVDGIGEVTARRLLDAMETRQEVGTA